MAFAGLRAALAGLWRVPMAQVQSGRGRFERLGVIWRASWTFWTIGKRFLFPNRLKRPFLSPKRRKRPSRARICTPNRRFRPRPPRLYSQSSKTSKGRGGPGRTRVDMAGGQHGRGRHGRVPPVGVRGSGRRGPQRASQSGTHAKAARKPNNTRIKTPA